MLCNLRSPRRLHDNIHGNFFLCFKNVYREFSHELLKRIENDELRNKNDFF